MRLDLVYLNFSGLTLRTKNNFYHFRVANMKRFIKAFSFLLVGIKMIVQKDFLLKLRDFGLNTYESKLWTALLSQGSSTAGELSDIANVPRSRTYDVLETLEKKGFILHKLGKPIKYMAVPPEEVVSRVKQRVEKETKKQIQLIDELRGSPILSELTLLHSQGIEHIDPTELTGSITGRENLYHHMESRISKAKESVSLIASPDGLKRKSSFLVPAFKKLRARGVRVKIMTKPMQDSRETLGEISQIAEIRHAPVSGRLCIIDKKEVLFMLLDDQLVHPSYDTGVWINTSYFASLLEDAFEARWNSVKKM